MLSHEAFRLNNTVGRFFFTRYRGKKMSRMSENGPDVAFFSISAAGAIVMLLNIRSILAMEKPC